MHSTTLANKLLKGFALLQVLIALIILVIGQPPAQFNWTTASVLISGALVMLFCARETINDERVEQLKLKACKIGLFSGALIAMLANFLSTMSGASMPFSAFDVLIVIMLISLGCFYFWRWQDSRPET
ncbi:MAG: hypothetical protein H3C27_06365 [Opitutaceae bacterium]|nr:hypothetical protein [Opitutaceae bacterium]